jgi:hypothetical protein
MMGKNESSLAKAIKISCETLRAAFVLQLHHQCHHHHQRDRHRSWQILSEDVWWPISEDTGKKGWTVVVRQLEYPNTHEKSHRIIVQDCMQVNYAGREIRYGSPENSEFGGDRNETLCDENGTAIQRQVWGVAVRETSAADRNRISCGFIGSNNWWNQPHDVHNRPYCQPLRRPKMAPFPSTFGFRVAKQQAKIIIVCIAIKETLSHAAAVTQTLASIIEKSNAQARLINVRSRLLFYMILTSCDFFHISHLYWWTVRANDSTVAATPDFEVLTAVDAMLQTNHSTCGQIDIQFVFFDALQSIGQVFMRHRSRYEPRFDALRKEDIAGCAPRAAAAYIT